MRVSQLISIAGVYLPTLRTLPHISKLKSTFLFLVLKNLSRFSCSKEVVFDDIFEVLSHFRVFRKTSSHKSLQSPSLRVRCRERRTNVWSKFK